VAHKRQISDGGTKCVRRPADFSQSSPPEISVADYLVWRDYIKKCCGHFITEGRIRFLRQRLWERMLLLNITKYIDYYHFVAFNPQGGEEWLALLELLVNNETSFFRHQPSFLALEECVFPALRELKEQNNDLTLRMWSAGCSTGQEPYSLAMTFGEVLASHPEPLSEGGWGGVKQLIYGTDICLNALEKARSGVYKPHELRQLPEEYLLRYMEKKDVGNKVSYSLVKFIQEVVKFGYLHLLDPSSYWITAQDIIFCQNVMIYFESTNRLELVRRLSQRLNPGGYLFLGPAEVVGLRLPGFQLINFKDVLLYRKII